MDAVDLELLDLVRIVVIAHKDGNLVHLATGIQIPKGVFHVAPACRVADGEGPWCMRAEECLDDLLCLITAAII